jgi:hypothetical protein
VTTTFADETYKHAKTEFIDHIAARDAELADHVRALSETEFNAAILMFAVEPMKTCEHCSTRQKPAPPPIWPTFLKGKQ